DKYIRGSARRRERAAQQRAAAAVAGANPDSKHSVLIAAAAEAHKESPMLSGYELLFIDDGDGDRIKEPYATKLKKAGLELNLDTRYPDTIFAHATKRELWIIDAVTSDGEIDPVRLTEISKWAEDAGWTLAGATTAYETFDRYAARQKAMTNIASDTYVWIAEIGGQLLHVKSLA
ncbi:MAG TPA: BsuBI/PstI family type II restriction endonuclease, partial [Gaiellaceae bacterium]|nr:BsuBI/PstI family type II restriction endonuclease [Gaiellaceae bacterium]